MGNWYDSAIFYHIYPLGLCGAPKINDGGEITDRLKDLEKWLFHIKNLGCNALYIGPLFESIEHGYDTTDYKIIDRRLGDNEGFRNFVKRSHDLGIKVVVDGVFNHTGRKFFAFEDIKANRENSRYKDWYCGINFYGNNEYNDGFSYESWRGCNVLVKLNQKNPEVKQYLFDVIQFWMEEFQIDGIRLDCADVLDFDFMKEMRQFCDNLKPEFWLMGEVIHGDYSRWVNNEMLHSVTNYELHKGLYSGHNDHNYFEIAHTVRRLFDEGGGICKDARLYSFIDNHDVDRIIEKLNNKDHLYSIYTLLYTLPGIPSIYYGSEFGVKGKKADGGDYALRPELALSDYCTECKEGNIIYTDTVKPLVEYIISLADIRNECEELIYGRYKELMLTNRQYAFARIMDNQAVIAAVNNDDEDAEVLIPLPIDGIAADLFTKEKIPVANGKIKVMINKGKGVLVHVKPE